MPSLDVPRSAAAAPAHDCQCKWGGSTVECPGSGRGPTEPAAASGADLQQPKTSSRRTSARNPSRRRADRVWPRITISRTPQNQRLRGSPWPARDPSAPRTRHAAQGTSAPQPGRPDAQPRDYRRTWIAPWISQLTASSIIHLAELLGHAASRRVIDAQAELVHSSAGSQLSGRSPHGWSLRAHRQLSQVVRVTLGYLPECLASMRTEGDDHVRHTRRQPGRCRRRRASSEADSLR